MGLHAAGPLPGRRRRGVRAAAAAFQAEQPSECWQAGFTHYPLAGGTGSEILTWLDDHSRYALRLTAHTSATCPAVLATFRAATACTARPKATPGDRENDTHDRARTGTSGKVTLRHGGKPYHTGIGRTHPATHTLLLAQDLHVRVINAATGELPRELTIDPTRSYQPTGQPRSRRKNSTP